MKFKDCWLSDYYRNTDGDTYKPYKYFFMGKKLRMIYWLRRCQCSRGLFQFISRLIYRRYSYWNNNDIPYKTQIGKGLYLGHSGGRYINKEAKIGDNCNINHNVTIGKENRGGRLGCPTIGSKVWIGCNSVIVGKVFIGDNVMIAPNSFVNFDVPSNSLVISGKIIKKDNSTEKYINNIV